MVDFVGPLQLTYTIPTEQGEYCAHAWFHLARNMRNDRTIAGWTHPLQSKHVVHPAVIAAMETMPQCEWPTICFEWPHRSEGDWTRVAYTQNAKKGAANIQTVTTIGKYLKRHFPTMSDHAIRDIGARFNTAGAEILRDTDSMIAAIQEGPYSCMKWEGRDSDSHPYQCYSPEHGWALAVIRMAGKVVARGLVHESGDTKVFVRTYTENSAEYSQAHEGLDAWLKGMGYAKQYGWDTGTTMAHVRSGGDTIFPYLDGVNDRVDICGGELVISANGEYLCDCTDGTSTLGRQCDDCGNRADEGDGLYIGRDDGRWVCSCCGDSYSFATGRRGEEYYLPDSEVVVVDGTAYDPEYLSENDIVELDNGEYSHLDNAFCCPIQDAWYSDDEAAYTEDEGTVHSDEAWECEGDGKTYSTNITPVTVDGMKYHPDNVPEEDEEETGEDTPA